MQTRPKPETIQVHLGATEQVNRLNFYSSVLGQDQLNQHGCKANVLQTLHICKSALGLVEHTVHWLTSGHRDLWAEQRPGPSVGNVVDIHLTSGIGTGSCDQKCLC